MEKHIILTGKVQQHRGRGKKLGFPTLNFPVASSLPEGIYCSQIILNQKSYNALTFIGVAKTYNETVFQAETYILNFDQDVYGENVQVVLLKKIRDNQKFDSEEALIKQMEEDRKIAEAYFKRL